MDGPARLSDTDRELADLRARAYGPDADIDADPVAFARLVELEAAHSADRATGAPTGSGAAPATDTDGVAAPATPGSAAEQVVLAPEPRTDTPNVRSWRTLWQRATATRSRRISFATGSIAVLVIASVYSAIWLFGPHPDATLSATEPPESRINSLMGALGLEGDVATLRGYEPYRGVEPWFVMHLDGYQCLMAVDTSRTGVFNAQCVPPDTDLFVDLTAWPEFDDSYVASVRGRVFAEGLPDGSLIRFHLRGDEVDAFLYPAPDTD